MRKARYLLAGMAAFFFYLSAPLSAPADFIRIMMPDDAYTRATKEILIADAMADGTKLKKLSDAILTITFSPIEMEVRTVPGSWTTWSKKPNSESDTLPRVLFTGTAAKAVVLTFDRPLQTFGVEMEPGRLGIFPMTARFFHDDKELGSITQNINGFQGARLFAGTTTTDPFTSVKLEVPETADTRGFAIAHVRNAVPEPGSVTLLGMAALTLGAYSWLHRKRCVGFHRLANS